MRPTLASFGTQAKSVMQHRATWIGCAMLAIVAPHLLPAATMGALDLLRGPTAFIDPSETAQDNFPGSAFFYAEGAFDPAPGTTVAQSSKVLALSNGPAAIAAPFRGLTAVDQYRATNCLTSAIYYEAGNEPDDGQRAVAQVVLNRVRHPAWPNSVCGVVYQGSERADTKCQFTFSCDGAMARMPNSASWARARRIATEALAGAVYAPVGLATHYHTLAVHPAWANSLTPVAVVGAHIFYRWQGMNGTARAFSVRYSGRELQAGPSPRIFVPTQGVVPPIAPIIALPSPFSPPAMQEAAPAEALPQSTIRPEFRNSGRPLPDKSTRKI